MKTRLLSFILTAAVAVTALPLASCGSKEPEPVKSRVDHVYKATAIELGEDIDPSMIVSLGNGAIVLARETVENEDYSYQYVLLNVDAGTGTFEKTVIEPRGKNEYINKIAASGGSLLLLINGYNEETVQSFYRIDRMTDGVCETVCGDIGAVLESSGSDTFSRRNNFYVGNFAADGDGNVYISSDSAIAVLDPDMNYLFELEVSDYVDTLVSVSDDRVCASYYDYESGGKQVRFIDVAKKDFGDNVPFPDTKNFRNADLYFGKGYDLYYSDSSSLYGFNSTDAEPTELLNFINSDINPNAVRSLAIIDADTIVCYSYDFRYDNSSPELLILNRIPEEEIPERYVIRIALTLNGDGLLESNAVRFNRSSDEYRVELIDYTQFSTDDDYYGEGQLEKDLLAGTAPDIVLLSHFDKSGDWLAQDCFYDLNKLIDKDESFDRSKYFDCIFDEFTNAKGELCEFIINFTLGTILANRQLVDFDHWDAKKFIEYASSLPSDVYLSDYMSRDMLIYLALACSLDSFIDYKNATCSFDSDEFRQLLELAKSTPEQFSYASTLSGDDLADYEDDMGKPFREGKIALNGNDGSFYSLDAYTKATVCCGEDGEVVFIGYPTTKGNGTIILPGMSFGITKNSPVKQGAWEFIKYMSESDIGIGGFRNGFPSNIERFDESCEEEIGGWNYFYGNGSSGFGKGMTYDEVMESLERMWKRSGKQDGVLRQVTEEDAAALKELISGAQALPDLNSKVFEIINEEAAMYYSDAKSLDETVKVIQDRVSIYISENS